MSNDIDIEIRHRNPRDKNSALEFVVDGKLDDAQRFQVICQYQQLQTVIEMSRRAADDMATLTNQLRDLTRAVTGLTGVVIGLSEEGIKARLVAEVEKATQLAIETLGGLR